MNNNNPAANVVEAILTAVLQWRVLWLDEQKGRSEPPPICRRSPRKLKITYDNYKDYESTFVPLLMHEIWAQIFDEWTRLENEMNGVPMDIDDGPVIGPTSNPLVNRERTRNFRSNNGPLSSSCPRQFSVGMVEYRSDGDFQCKLRCQYLVESNKLQSQLRIVGEGDLVRLDLITQIEAHHIPQDPTNSRPKNMLSLFAYVVDVSSERVTNYTELAHCYPTRPARHHAVNYQLVIAKRPLRLDLSQPVRMYGIYYLKPMIRQIEAVATLNESELLKDILCPKHITCQVSVPTVVSIKSPHYNDMQYKAIIGANEAIVRNIPKIQLIQGPPGTGKTHTLVGIVKHFYAHWLDPLKTQPKILICAPSNGAIDEVSRRLYREREFLKATKFKRSLRMVRVGHPDQISESIKAISLEELVEINANSKVEGTKRRQDAHIQELEKELSRCDTEISNLRYTKCLHKIPDVEAKIMRLMKELEVCRANADVNVKREVSEAAKKSIRYDLVKNADIILTTLNSCQRSPLDRLFRGDRAELSFHCVIVDEASQCCEPELLMPLCYKISKIILIGDPMQLPATVISKHAAEFDFGRSLFERFFIHFGHYSETSPIAMLTEQYRMHPDICSFPSKQFYDGRLITSRKPLQNYPLKPYLIFDLRHGAESKSNRTSLENEVEASFVRNLLVAVLSSAPESSKIGVITPYKGQKRLITNKVETLKSQRNITVDVNTCDGFQGQEKDIIILSCVRASEGGSVGFLKSFQRINVALTRAKHALIVCISTKTLSKDKTWSALINDAIDRCCLQAFTHTPSSDNLAGAIKNNKATTSDQIDASASFSRSSNKQIPRLVKTNGSTDQAETVEPEFVMDMDID